MLENSVITSFYVKQICRMNPMRFICKGIYTPLSIPNPLGGLVLPRNYFYSSTTTIALI